jgi:hypothetical protein
MRGKPLTRGRWFVHHPAAERMITAIVRTVMPSSGAGKEDLVKETSQQLQGILDIMPFFLAAPLLALTGVFELWGMGAGARFSRLSPQKRRELVRQWRESRITLMQDFIQFYQKMAVFIYYSLLTEREFVGDGTDPR